MQLPARPPAVNCKLGSGGKKGAVLFFLSWLIARGPNFLGRNCGQREEGRKGLAKQKTARGTRLRNRLMNHECKRARGYKHVRQSVRPVRFYDKCKSRLQLHQSRKNAMTERPPPFGALSFHTWSLVSAMQPVSYSVSCFLHVGSLPPSWSFFVSLTRSSYR